LGYVLPYVAETLIGLPEWNVDPEERALTLIEGNTVAERSALIANTGLAMRETGHFKVLAGWRNELYPVYGPGGELIFNMERSLSCLFGIVTYGSHMTAYTRNAEDGTLKFWVPRRSYSKSTYPGILDNTVAGGLATGEVPFECIVREAEEEASLPEAYVRPNVKAVGVVSYFHIRGSRAGGETDFLQPEVEYLYELELPKEIIPKPSDGEVEEFYLWSIDELMAALGRNEFKPNCAVVFIDFMIRHNILTPENEKDYLDISSRLHRKLVFPTGLLFHEK